MKRGYVVLLVLIVGVIVVVLSFWPSGVKKLSSVEVREYRGERLSSVDDFRENSIKGVQYINISDYSLEIFGFVDGSRNYTYDEVLG